MGYTCDSLPNDIVDWLHNNPNDINNRVIIYRCLIDEEKYNIIISDFYTITIDNPNQKISDTYYLIYSLFVYALYLNLDAIQALNHIQNLEVQILDNTPKLWKAYTYLTKGMIYLGLNENTEAIFYLNQAVYQLGNHDDSIRAYIYTQLGIAYRKTYSLEHALKSFKYAYEIYFRINSKKEMFDIFQNIGNIYFLMGKLNLSNEFYKKALSIKIPDNREFANIMLQFGQIKQRLGNLDIALEYYERAYNAYKEINDIDGISESYKFYSDIYISKGELEVALDYLKDALDLMKQTKNEWKIAKINLRMGKLYQKMGKYDLSYRFLSRSLQVFRIKKDYENGSEAIINLILLLIEINKFDELSILLSYIEDIAKRVEFREIKSRSKLARGLYLKSQPRLTPKMEAKKIFEQIIKEKIIDYRISVIAMLNLCDLLLLEYRVVNHPDILKEISKIIEQLTALSLEQQSYTLYAEVLIIKAKIALLKNELEYAGEILDEALKTTHEKNLKHIQEKVQHEIDVMKEQVKTWNEFYKKNFDHIERMKKTEIQQYLNTLAIYFDKM